MASSPPLMAPSPSLMALDEALEHILGGEFALPDIETCPLDQALGRTLARDIPAQVAVPGDDNSAMDGYALRAQDSDRELRVAQRIPAGHSGKPLEPGTAARIFTGAPIPSGADAVVMQEHCEVEGDRLKLLQKVSSGENIRARGQDIRQGETVFAAGRRLRGEDLGVLASVGCAAVPVYRRLVVSILSTGNELVDPADADALQPGQVFNSNRHTLKGLLTDLGMEVRDFGVVRDSAEATADALRRAAADGDCVISSGGVSVGEEDHVKNQVEALGELHLWKLRIKPGKPLAYGWIEGGRGDGDRMGPTPFFGLPGNPAAVFITFLMVVRPWLLRRQGAESEEPLRLQARAGFALDQSGFRLEFLRARVSVEGEGLRVVLHPNQSSGVLSSVSWANALAVVPPDTTIAPDDLVEVLLLDQLNR